MFDSQYNYSLQDLPSPASNFGSVPSTKDCISLWDKYQMLSNIRLHSQLVAQIASTVALLFYKQNDSLEVQSVRAAALLHDLGKSYTILYGGNHCQLGASWVIENTGNPAIAQGVFHHIHWPGPLKIDKYLLPLSIIYADKRVKHDKIVSLNERFQDLINRYGVNQKIITSIKKSFQQAREIESLFSNKLHIDLSSYTF